jgi:hypothetical protein
MLLSFGRWSEWVASAKPTKSCETTIWICTSPECGWILGIAFCQVYATSSHIVAVLYTDAMKYFSLTDTIHSKYYGVMSTTKTALPYVGTQSCGDEKLTPVDCTSDSTKHQKTVIIAKHLCGLATDISLRSLQTFSNKTPTSGDQKEDQRVAKNAHGVAIATCCHHACSWEDYTGCEWLQARGLSSQEFDVMKVWSSWAHTLTKKIRTAEELAARKLSAHEVADAPETSKEESKESKGGGGGGGGGDKEEEEEEDHGVDPSLASSVPRPAGISLKEMSVIGRMVKRIFDQGRVAYLQRLGMKAHQRRYCDESLSPECYMIIATQDGAA